MVTLKIPELPLAEKITRRIYQPLAVITLFMCAACTSNPWNVQHLLLSETPYTARTQPEKIEIFRTGGTTPNRPHLEIAQVSVREQPLHLPSSAQLSMESTLLQAKTRASELGGDAIKEVRINVAPTGVYGAGSVSIDGVVIRWK